MENIKDVVLTCIPDSFYEDNGEGQSYRIEIENTEQKEYFSEITEYPKLFKMKYPSGMKFSVLIKKDYSSGKPFVVFYKLLPVRLY